MSGSPPDAGAGHGTFATGGVEAPGARPGILTAELIAELAHELGTPLTSIKGYVDYLLEGIAGDLSPVQRDFLERAKANTTRLMSLLGDLLDLMRIETGRMVPHPVSVPLAAAIAEVIGEVRRAAAEGSVELAARDAAGAVVRADREMLQRLLLSLLRRAVSRTPAGGRVEAEVERQDSGSVVIVVRDTGAGAILPEDRLFATFESPAAAATRDKRTGLELPMAKALVELHGGRIWARSEPGGDGAICFTLPGVEREAAR